MHIKEEAIESAEWLRAARGYEVKVLMEDGDIAKFDGFKESVCMQDEVNVLMCVCVCVCVCENDCDSLAGQTLTQGESLVKFPPLSLAYETMCGRLNYTWARR